MGHKDLEKNEVVDGAASMLKNMGKPKPTKPKKVKEELEAPEDLKPTGAADEYAEDAEDEDEDAFAGLDSDTEVAVNSGVFFIDNKKCLRCMHLIGDISDKAKEFDCTKENGNSNCPAARGRIALGMDVDSAVSEYLEALAEGELIVAANILNTVAKYDEVIIQQFSVQALGSCCADNYEAEDDLAADNEDDEDED